MKVALALVWLVVAAHVAHAQSPAAPHPACNGSPANATPPINTTPGFVVPPAPGPAVQWTELAIDAADPSTPLLDPPETIRALLLPAFDHSRMNDEPTRTNALAHATATYGYQLVRVDVDTVGQGVRATLRLAPLPLVRQVLIDVPEELFNTQYDEEIRRRMAIKAGSYLPYFEDNRTCALDDEAQRIRDYLHDEGYFDASVEFLVTTAARGATNLRVIVELNAEYIADFSNGQPDVIDNGSIKPLTSAEIREYFRHTPVCLLTACFGTRRFRRERHLEDIADVLKRYHKLGYPAARVTTDYNPREPARSLDRTRKVVTFAITVDAQRKLDVDFDGPDKDAIGDEQLRDQLTFDKAGSSDDVEAQLSANAIATYLQTRGYFDARVTWTRHRELEFDTITFHLELGPAREVAGVSFTHDDKAFTGEQLADLVNTKAVRLQDTLLGNQVPATSAGIAADRLKLIDAYRHAGYRDAQVHVTAATENDQAVLASAALAAALVSAGHGDALYVHFDIAAGPGTEVARVEIAIEPDPIHPGDADELCGVLLGALADTLAAPALKIRDRSQPGCVATPTGVLFRDDATEQSPGKLRDALAAKGHPRAVVAYREDDVAPHRVALHFDVHHTDTLQFGRIVIRGNYRTRDSIILGELQLVQGQPLTSVALNDAERRLRATGLFDAVDVELPALCTEAEKDCAAARDQVDAVVRVQERYDYWASIEVSGGYSSYSGEFVTAGPGYHNLFGIGLVDLPTITYGSKIFDLENVLRVPRWLLGHLFQGEIDAFYRRQDTPNFGDVETTGVTIALTRSRAYPRTLDSPAHTLSVTFHYDYRDRQRDVDAIRPIGIDDDQTQVPVTTITGEVGVVGEWDQRVDHNGAFAPLNPESGFRLNGSVAYASTYLLGQDDFLKLSLSGTRYFLLGDNLVLRADLRYDQGIPLGGEALLPEVEQFFAGGDNTVRGYNDDALKTELIQVGVPPFTGGVTQLRVLPAGGDIRVMGSLDAQIRIWKVFASGLFVDAGMITNQWDTVTEDDIRPAVGMSLLRVITPFGLGALEYAVPLRPQLGDDPRGRFHIYFSARAQF